MFHKKRTTFYCFSPPVMIATFVIEIALMTYSLWRYKFNALGRLLAALLLLLAIFQLAEFQVCEGTSGFAQWSHLGFVAITLLPPLGIHAIHIISKKKNLPLIVAAYASSAAFVAYFALTAHSLNGHQCLGNYVIFQVNQNMTVWYGIYYWGWVTFTMVLSYMLAQTVKAKNRRQALYGFSAGYAAFLVPTTAANLVNNTTISGIPSIMCGFAVLFALVLGLYVLPRVGVRRT